MKKIRCEICGVKTNRVGDRKRIFMAKFPLHEDRCKQWVKATGKEDLAYLPIEKLHQLKYICEKHFQSKDFNKKKTRLKKCAIPSFQIPSTPLPDEILVSFPLHIVTSPPRNLSPVRKSGDAQLPHNGLSGIIYKEHNYSHTFVRIPSDVADKVPHLEPEPAENETDNVADPYSDTELTEIETEETDVLNYSPKKDTFSWEMKSDALLVPEDEPEQIDDVREDLTMYCDNNPPIEVKRTGFHEGFHCNNCNGDIVGYRYTCVQCSELDLCLSCESSGAHAQHYMLRVPGPRPYNEIQSVLARIRKLLMKEFDPISAGDLDNEDAVSVKSEIKSEDENERDVEQIDDITENAVEPESGEYSRLSPSKPQCSENANFDVVVKNNVPIERQIKITNINLINNSENLDPLEVESPYNRVSTLSDTAKRKLVVRLSDCVKLNLSNELGKRKLCVTPSTSKQDIKETNTILSNRTVLDRSKMKYVRLTEETLNLGHTVPLQKRATRKPQTNGADENS